MKKTETLVSMVEYVLGLAPKVEFKRTLIRHAKFQDTPLTLGLFVPCDLEGNILVRPKMTCDESGKVFVAAAIGEIEAQKVRDKSIEYNQALERVIFPDFHVTYSDRSTVIESPKQKIEIVFYSDRIELNGIIVRLVSDLVGHNIQYYTQ